MNNTTQCVEKKNILVLAALSSIIILFSSVGASLQGTSALSPVYTPGAPAPDDFAPDPESKATTTTDDGKYVDNSEMPKEDMLINATQTEPLPIDPPLEDPNWNQTNNFTAG